MVNVSLFASAVRSKLWAELFKSLSGTSCTYDIVFAGNADFEFNPDWQDYFTYIYTKNIKPSQCYEVARRFSYGETILWIADDCEFHNDVIGKAYKYWKSQNNEKLILSIQTKESGYNYPIGQLFDMNVHRFFGHDKKSPLMAPLGLMSRKFLDELGGIDHRYVCGQYENDIVMRAYSKGAIVEIFGGSNCYIDIDHLGKSIAIGESTDKESFQKRPFATGYKQDREILEKSWCTLNQDKLKGFIAMGIKSVIPTQVYDISKIQLDQFEPYAKKISLIQSESNKGKWE